MQANPRPVHLLKYYMSKKGWVAIPSSGVSMFPLIQEGDLCRFIRIEKEEPLRVGDVILFISESGELIGHRLCRRYVNSPEMLFICKGDTNVNPDPPIRREQILGKLVSIQKKGFQIRVNGLLPRIWGWLMLHFPIFSRCLLRVMKAQKDRLPYESKPILHNKPKERQDGFNRKS